MAVFTEDRNRLTTGLPVRQDDNLMRRPHLTEGIFSSAFAWLL